MDPLYIAPLSCLLQHRLCRIQPTQPSGMTGLPRQSQQLARTAADIEHALRRHHQRKVEVKVFPSRAERII